MKSFWDERYSTPGFAYGRDPNDFLVEQEPRIPRNGRILCLAEGEGRNAVYLARCGHQVTAVDQSSVGLAKLKELAKENRVEVETICSDLADYKMEPQAFDAIVLIWCHLPIELRRQVHADCEAALRPGGVLLLEAYHPGQLQFKTGGPSAVELLMTLESLRDEFQGLKPWIAREAERDIHEGPFHQGRSSVVQWAAMKPV